MRKFYWYITSAVKKYWLVFLTSLIAAIIFFSLLIPYTSSFFATKERHYVGIIGAYTVNSLPQKITNQLSVGLTKIEENKEVVPLLAERWIVEDEGKKYRFILKKGITWQDGKELTPDDIRYQLPDVEIISTPNDVIFQLPDEYAPFPSAVAEPVFREVEERYNWFYKRNTIVGIGDHKVVDYVRNGNYLQEITVDGPKDRYIYRFYRTEDDAVLGFKRGEVDVIHDLSSKKDVSEWKTTVTEDSLLTNMYLAVFFNNSDPLLQKNVRKALSYAIAKPEGIERARGPIDPTSWAYLEGGKKYEQDEDRAIERLLDTLPPQPLELELATTNTFTQEAEEYKQQWEEIGEMAVERCENDKDVKDKEQCENLRIKINIKISNFPDTDSFQLLLMGQESPPDPDQYFLWHSEQPTNFTRYKNTRIDSLLEKGRKTIEQNERLAVYQEFQQFLLEDPPAIFIRHLYSHEVSRK